MKITYDKEVDALYIYFKKGKIAETRSINRDTLIDVDKKGDIIGLELLNASNHISDKKNKSEIFIGKRSVKLPALVD